MPKFQKVKPRENSYPSEDRAPEKKHQPTVHFDFNSLPQGRVWKVGEKYEITLRVKQIGLHVGEEEKMGGAEFEILESAGRPLSGREPRNNSHDDKDEY